MTPETKGTVLIVDDAPLNRQFLKDILSRGGFQTIGEAANGEEGIRLYAELQPDVVLMDIMMPGIDGIETTRAILRQDPQARVIMCSTVSLQNEIVAALQAGAQDFIVKPIVASKVLEVVHKACNS
jgi:two-component system chemotaxis response regulator CheY